MKISEKNYESIFNFLLYAISITLIFRKLSTFLIMCFVVFNLLFLRKLEFDKRKLILLLIISSPLILDIMFFWNNDNFLAGIKATEKHLTLLFFPLIILGFRGQIHFIKFIKRYSISTFIILSILFVRYIIVFNQNFLKYLSGKHLWEMGYHFSKSFGTHAPSLNMHVAFFSIISFYLLIVNWTKDYKKTICYLILFLSSLFFVMYINTRVSVVCAFLGFILISFFELLKDTNKILVLKKGSILLLFIFLSLFIFVKIFPYSLKKFTTGSFSNMDMVGRLDEFKNPEKEIYNKLVTRVTIWKTSLELSKTKFWIGFGAADSKAELNKHYEESNQMFLARNKFPVHNQFLDFLLKYGVLGLLIVVIYIFGIGYLGIRSSNPIAIGFCMLFFLSNLTDDFLIQYSGIAFSGLWFSIFANNYLYKCKSSFS